MLPALVVNFALAISFPPAGGVCGDTPVGASAIASALPGGSVLADAVRMDDAKSMSGVSDVSSMSGVSGTPSVSSVSGMSGLSSTSTVSGLALTSGQLKGDELPPGGYHRLGELRQSEPPDGREALMAGYALFSLGLLRTASGVAMLIMSMPSRCPDPESTYLSTSDDCRLFRTAGWVGTGFGGAVLLSGSAFLLKGLIERRKHRQWQLYGGGWAASSPGRAPGLHFGVSWRP